MKKIFLILTIILLSEPAFACKCRRSPLGIYENNQYIFLAEVTGFEKLSFGENNIENQSKPTVKIKKVWKGELEEGKEIKVDARSGCGLIYEADKTYLISANRDGDLFKTNFCSDLEFQDIDQQQMIEWLNFGTGK